jgi:hypothetical protein
MSTHQLIAWEMHPHLADAEGSSTESALAKLLGQIVDLGINQRTYVAT